MSKKFYITTPLYYVTAKPHIGTAYTTILADVITRYHKAFGEDSFFLTGTDEHGSKISEKATENSMEPKAFTDKMAKVFKNTWPKLHVNYDFFIRTTDDYHIKVVQTILQRLYDKKEIYLDTYTGQYCTPCERFWTESDLIEGKCPDCKRPTKALKEQNYFFKMSKYQKQLIKHIKDNPNFIVPESRKNEVLGFLQKPLGDLCISRTKERLNWGIDLPFDSKYVTYVWFDALINYISGPGYLQDDALFESRWPADYHLIGKDILTTHAVYWSTMLMAIGIELPKTILAHGWWLSGGDKMSKSKGNVVAPLDYAKKYDVDIFRYFLIREMSPGQDSNFTHEIFLKVVNSELANDLGNLVSRSTKMILNYFEGITPSEFNFGEKEQQIQSHANRALDEAKDLIYSNKFNQALATIMEFVRTINKYIVETEPWTLAKDPNNNEATLKTVLYTCIESLRTAICFLSPVMPEKSKLALITLGIPEEYHSISAWGTYKGGSKVQEAKALFPRIKD